MGFLGIPLLLVFKAAGFGIQALKVSGAGFSQAARAQRTRAAALLFCFFFRIVGVWGLGFN